MEEEKMLEQLNTLIASVQSFYYQYNKLYHDEYSNFSFNVLKYKVKNITENPFLLTSIYTYRTFLLNNSIDSELKETFLQDNILNNASLFVRIKTENFIQDKIDRYNNKEHHNYGEEPINKCLNDIL
jgi:hypothetical protein